jgi:hypothetical protein
MTIYAEERERDDQRAGMLAVISAFHKEINFIVFRMKEIFIQI